MDRCAQAYQYHRTGYNCAQSVAAAFADLTDFTPEQVAAMAAGFGGGVGGSRSELCGAISGGVLVLSLLHPHTDGADAAGKRAVYQKTKEFRRRFEAVFGLTCCGPDPASRRRTRPLRDWVSPPTATIWWLPPRSSWSRCWRRSRRAEGPERRTVHEKAG